MQFTVSAAPLQQAIKTVTAILVSKDPAGEKAFLTASEREVTVSVFDPLSGWAEASIPAQTAAAGSVVVYTKPVLRTLALAARQPSDPVRFTADKGKGTVAFQIGEDKFSVFAPAGQVPVYPDAPRDAGFCSSVDMLAALRAVAPACGTKPVSDDGRYGRVLFTGDGDDVVVSAADGYAMIVCSVRGVAGFLGGHQQIKLHRDLARVVLRCFSAGTDFRFAADSDGRLFCSSGSVRGCFLAELDGDGADWQRYENVWDGWNIAGSCEILGDDPAEAFRQALSLAAASGAGRVHVASEEGRMVVRTRSSWAASSVSLPAGGDLEFLADVGLLRSNLAGFAGDCFKAELRTDGDSWRKQVLKFADDTGHRFWLAPVVSD